ncbi:MAG: hypothetical protein OEM51_14275, partial [Gammaproteobacteria bacterium]|nr:hypothetical protein [Gammaproteobacteria bacterium]
MSPSVEICHPRVDQTREIPDISAEVPYSFTSRRAYAEFGTTSCLSRVGQRSWLEELSYLTMAVCSRSASSQSADWGLMRP